ncbi:phosphoribosylamine--glycine ligase [Gangjinia marincola]|uniref:Phosphoribosylamine--glycine ligase n=1 Tax=Gangjinia marincola TaxID=578463 RepID=A0ABN1MHV8_9FLAO
MNILILGSGGREHAFAHKMVQSKQCDHLYVAPGNAGTQAIAINVPLNLNDFAGIKKFVLEHSIKMLVVGPEDPLVNGIYDFFNEDKELNHIAVIGPSKKAAMLEGSKDFAKQFMQKYDIPTAAYQSFTAETLDAGKAFLDKLKAPYVLKADGLAAGKGVLILNDLAEAKAELTQMLTNKKFGAASETVVIEEFLNGLEMSVFVITDGKNYKILPTAKDYKRIGEGDTGLNTGGMGAISPVPFVDEALMKKIEEKVIKPTIQGIQAEAMQYNGFVFLGLINVGNEPYVIEYNVRMGDPETEVVLPRLKSDLVELFKHTANQSLDEVELEIDSNAAATVMLVSGGYPEAYEKGKVIRGVETIESSIVFHAGTALKNNELVTNGGRVIAVTSMAEDFKKALATSYQNVERISFEGKYIRKDIGFDL